MQRIIKYKTTNKNTNLNLEDTAMKKTSIKNFLSVCKDAGVTNIAVVYDYGYKKMYAFAHGKINGKRTRIESTSVLPQTIKKLAQNAKNRGLAIELPYEVAITL